MLLFFYYLFKFFSQSQTDEKNDFFGSKDTTTYSIPNLSTMMPKKYDENQDTQTQDENVSQDLHNGHNIQNDDKVVKRLVFKYFFISSKLQILNSIKYLSTCFILCYIITC